MEFSADVKGEAIKFAAEGSGANLARCQAPQRQGRQLRLLLRAAWAGPRPTRPQEQAVPSLSIRVRLSRASRRGCQCAACGTLLSLRTPMRFTHCLSARTTAENAHASAPSHGRCHQAMREWETGQAKTEACPHGKAKSSPVIFRALGSSIGVLLRRLCIHV